MAATAAHIAAWLKYPDASAPAADRVENTAATIALASAMPSDEFRMTLERLPRRLEIAVNRVLFSSARRTTWRG